MQIGEVYHKIEAFNKRNKASAQPIMVENRNQAIYEVAKQTLEEDNKAAAKSMKKACINMVFSTLETSPPRRRERSATEEESNSIDYWMAGTQDIWDSLQDIRKELREANPNLKTI